MTDGPRKRPGSKRSRRSIRRTLCQIPKKLDNFRRATSARVGRYVHPHVGDVCSSFTETGHILECGKLGQVRPTSVGRLRSEWGEIGEFGQKRVECRRKPAKFGRHLPSRNRPKSAGQTLSKCCRTCPRMVELAEVGPSLVGTGSYRSGFCKSSAQTGDIWANIRSG